MAESAELRAARRLLAEAEAGLETAAGLARLAEAIDSLDGVIAGANAADARTARNLASTYASRIYGRIGTRLGNDAQVPEPVLELYFKAALAFDAVVEALPNSATELKVTVVRALIERYYEGHPEQHKREALAQLAKIGGK